MTAANNSAHILLIGVGVLILFVIFYRSSDSSAYYSIKISKDVIFIAGLVFLSFATDYLLGWIVLQKVRNLGGELAQYVWFWVGSIGFVVGAVELIARYKDNPQGALATGPALLYIFINILACEFVLTVLQIMEPKWLYEDVKDSQRPLYLIISAGFGAVALFRSSIFKIKTADGELAVGPAVILDTLLAASDRAVDRIIAAPRGMIVADIMRDVSFDQAKIALPTYCFALMQNVSHQEQKDVGDQVNYLSTSIMPGQVKSLNLGLVLLNVVGEKVLRCALTNLKTLINGETPIEQQDVAKICDLMAGVNFDKAVSALPAYCYSLVNTISPEVQFSVNSRIQTLAQSDIQSRVKTLVLGLALSNIVGFSVLKLAVEQLGEDIK